MNKKKKKRKKNFLHLQMKKNIGILLAFIVFIFEFGRGKLVEKRSFCTDFVCEYTEDQTTVRKPVVPTDCMQYIIYIQLSPSLSSSIIFILFFIYSSPYESIVRSIRALLSDYWFLPHALVHSNVCIWSHYIVELVFFFVIFFFFLRLFLFSKIES